MTARTPPRPRTFRRAVALTVAGTAIPGLGLIAGRRRIIGSVILGLFAAGLLALGVYAAFDRQGLLARAVDPTTLRRAALALVVIGIVWVAVIIASHLCLRSRPTRGQRVIGGILVAVLSFAVAAPTAVAVLTHIVKSIVDDPESVVVEEVDSDGKHRLDVRVGADCGCRALLLCHGKLSRRGVPE